VLLELALADDDLAAAADAAPGADRIEIDAELARAASSTVVPSATRPRRPDGVKTIRRSGTGILPTVHDEMP
jgi:hypothetical protein